MMTHSNINYLRRSMLWGCVALLCSAAWGQAPPQAPEPELMLPDPEVLEQGPIHEAFAEPLPLDRLELEVVPKRPPEPVQEIPPDARPEGRNVQWIPGYFLWDRDRKDFVWVSGLWRDVPPGRTWVPGEWQEVEGGWQRVPGFWADADEADQLRLLPIPPDSLEAGPSSPAPGDDYLWAPGCWIWQQTGYAWQTGYWYRANPNWIWVPSHYAFTPRGVIFVSGYWDFLPPYRGWLYAPLYWRSGFAGYGGLYFYRPRAVINTGLLTFNLFIDRGYGRYYFGYNAGSLPVWLAGWGVNYNAFGHYHGKHHVYDPWWSHERWHHRDQFPKGHSGPNRSGDHVAGAGRRNEPAKRFGKLIGSPEDFARGGNKQFQSHKLSQSEVAQARKQEQKFHNFDRSRIRMDANTQKLLGADAHGLGRALRANDGNDGDRHRENGGRIHRNSGDLQLGSQFNRRLQSSTDKNEAGARSRPANRNSFRRNLQQDDGTSSPSHLLGRGSVTPGSQDANENSNQLRRSVERQQTLLRNMRTLNGASSNAVPNSSERSFVPHSRSGWESLRSQATSPNFKYNRLMTPQNSGQGNSLHGWQQHTPQQVMRFPTGQAGSNISGRNSNFGSRHYRSFQTSPQISGRGSSQSLRQSHGNVQRSFGNIGSGVGNSGGRSAPAARGAFMQRGKK